MPCLTKPCHIICYYIRVCLFLRLQYFTTGIFTYKWDGDCVSVQLFVVVLADGGIYRLVAEFNLFVIVAAVAILFLFFVSFASSRSILICVYSVPSLVTSDSR